MTTNTTPSGADALLPCPFCGGEAEIITLQGETDELSIGAQAVQCTNHACGSASGLVYPLMDDVTHLLVDRWNRRAALSAAQDAPAVSAGDAVFAFASMLTSLPRVVPFGSASWATPGAELASAFNAANGLSVSRDFPEGLAFPKIEGELLACVEKAAQAQEAAPAAQGDPSAWHRIEEDAEVDVPLDTDLLLAWWDEWSEAWKIEVNHAGSERGGWRHGRATHWRPLPAPPSAAQQKGASNG